LEKLEDPAPIYVGIIVFAVALTIIIILMFRLDWHRILGNVAPWTLEEDEDNSKS
jgi:hypothetical protein